jgi:hypothetical protein
LAVEAPRGRRPLLRRLLGALGAAPSLACAAALFALLCCPLARADDASPPPTTTTDAPPPDRYTPQPKPTPKKVAPVTHVSTRPTLRTYTPPVTHSTPAVTASKPVHRARTVHRQQKKKVTHRQAKPVSVSLAPLAHVLAAARLPAPPAPDERDPYLWLAGLSFAVLAVAGLSLQVLTVRYVRPELK